MSIIRVHLIAALVVSPILLIVSCASHRSAISMNDTGIFMEPPKIIEMNAEYFLAFRYARNAFLMSIDSGIENGNLVFYVSGMTSTGSPGGRAILVQVRDRDRIALIRENRVFWKEPDDSLVWMKIEKAAGHQ